MGVTLSEGETSQYILLFHAPGLNLTLRSGNPN